MISPHDRETYSDALRPPPGYRFDEAVAATYSLDLTTLLTVPLHLALYSGDQPMEELLGDGIALLDALRKTSAGIDVYCQQGRIAAPDVPRVLFSLLEPIVHEARAPAGGSFHPKLWVLRFRPVDDARPVRLRTLVLTRNLTPDRCWDLALSLEGEPGAVPREENRELAALIRILPDFAPAAGRGAAERAERLAAEVERCAWELPDGFEALTFHALGLPGTIPGRSWRPLSNYDLIVISPFVTARALEMLAKTASNRILALVSRPDELAALPAAVRDRFGQVLVLSEGAEAEDGEDVPEYRDLRTALRGLHAKAYIYSRNRRTHVVLGSANATDAALVAERNVELLAELSGPPRRVGKPRDVLDPDKFGKVLAPYRHDEDAAPDEEAERARERLERARDALAAAGMTLRCEREEDARWRLVLRATGPFALPERVSARTWPVTLSADGAQDAAALLAGESVAFETDDVAHLTTFIAFELATSDPEARVRFVLTLPIADLPAADRDAAIIYRVIQNRHGFVRYLLLMLAGEGEDLGGMGGLPGTGNARGWPPGAELEDVPLLEEMTRAYCRDLPKLHSVRRLVEGMAASEAHADIVPPEFWEVWKAFEQALVTGREGNSSAGAAG